MYNGHMTGRTAVGIRKFATPAVEASCASLLLLETTPVRWRGISRSLPFLEFLIKLLQLLFAICSVDVSKSTRALPILDITFASKVFPAVGAVWMLGLVILPS